MSQLRAVAAHCVHQVIEHGHSLNRALPEALNRVPANDKALLQEICYGTIRWYPKLALYVKKLLKRPIKHKDRIIESLIAIGLYQIAYMRIAQHAALSETVSATAELKRDWAKGLVNGTLREFLRNEEALSLKLRGNPSFSFAHPQWLIEQFKTDWPQHWRHILNDGNRPAPLCLRINQQKVSREAYIERLTALGHTCYPCSLAPHGIYLNQSVDVEKLPGFTDGIVSVQDEAAQLVSYALDLQSHQHFLDACCAPGGKLCHALEIEPNLSALGLDLEEQRQVRTKENLHRLSLHAQLKVGRADNKAEWWDGELFDRILVDAPCSGTSVIRRHPDIKMLRTPEDLSNLAELQLAILLHLWPTLKPDGILVYSTCSVITAENSLLVEQFCQKCPDAQIEICELPQLSEQHNLASRLPEKAMKEHSFNEEEKDSHHYRFMQTPWGNQFFPTENSHDGFFFTRIRKATL